ncbi:MAG: exodeoxyribonuclease VII large subunit, partial [Bacteroidaceae bacterium]|nr:exodeoxyribonuclease VII large subunit [Bacteroidaceae bacterium]
LPLPPLTQRIAVVSASTAAGYGDFCHHLQHNPYHFRFSVQLFPAVMQGQYVEESILSALQQIADEAEEWDVVVIIRGGGAVADLACFDTYHLAAAVAQFPLPVIVGIGHERDETVLDYVAHKFVKTPTAAADFIIGNQTAQLTALDRFSARIHDAATLALRNRQDKLRNLTARMPLAVLKYTFRCNHRLQLMSRALSTGASSALMNAAHDADRLSQRLHTAVPLMLERRRHSLDLLAQKVAQNDPLRILRQGYSITTVRGKVVTDAAQIRPGDKIHTRLAQGEIVSECQEKNTTTSE